MFRRRRRQPEAEPVEDAPVDVDVEEPPADPAPARPAGPWDVDDAPEEVRGGQRLDLGGISVPVLPGLELRIDMDQQQKPVAATVVSGQSAMQVNAFAAPRSEGIWAEVRAEILESLQAGGAREVEGPWGPEVHSRVPAGPPVPGRGTPVVDARFIGIDGPRWFVRGLVSGPAATDPQLAAPFEEVLRGVVVVRGGEAMPPREPLPLTLPRQVQEAAAAHAEQQAAQQRADQAEQQRAALAAQAGAAQDEEPGARAGATGEGRPGAAEPRTPMADQLAAAARAVAARQAGPGTAPRPSGPAADAGDEQARAPQPSAAAPEPDGGPGDADRQDASLQDVTPRDGDDGHRAAGDGVLDAPPAGGPGLDPVGRLADGEDDRPGRA